MTDADVQKFEWHFTSPCCQILRGLKSHLAVISMAERWRLCHAFGVESAEQLCRIMWLIIKIRRTRC